MPDDKVTVDKLLSEDDLNELADKIVSGDLDNIIVIYRDKASSKITWMTTIKEWSGIFGTIEMVRTLIKHIWLEDDEEDEE